MALKFVMFAFLAVVASGLDGNNFGLGIADKTSLLQTSMSVESRRVQRDSSSSFGEALATCPSMSAVDIDGASCTSGVGSVKIKSMQTQKTDEAHKIVEATAPEEQGTTAPSTVSDSAEATISILRCLLNLVTFLFVMDILRRSVSSNCSGNLKDADPTAMLRACEKNHAATVKAMLDQGMPPYVEDNTGHTALHVAAKTGAAAVVDLLLQRGAKVDATDSWDETALHCAARAGAIDVCRSLLASGAKIDALNAQDWTPLVAAASRGQKDACEWLMAHGATQDSLPVASLPSVLQQLLKADEPDETPEPEFEPMPNLEAKLEADLLRRALEPKPEWEAESLPEWVAAVDDYDD